jgi:hypothetical protein
MNLRWQTGFTYCTNHTCEVNAECWRFTALERMLVDREDGVVVPFDTRSAHFKGGLRCVDYIEDYYDESDCHIRGRSACDTGF